MNWTNDFLHDDSGKIFGEVITQFYESKCKAMYENTFLGWYVSKDLARKAVEKYHKENATK